VRLSVADPARVTTPLAVGLGLVALAARVPSTWAILITVGVGAVGLVAPLPPAASAGRLAAARRTSVGTWLGALALGIGALLIAGRLPGILGIGPRGLVARRVGAGAVLASVVAAVAEEAFFRRLVYGWLATWGPAVAIGGSAVAFAAIHVPVYGFAVLPIDAAAGLLLGWQRWMTGGWSASGLTHVVANLIAEGVIA
jgi:hypothetical protein